MKYYPEETLTFDPMKESWNEFEDRLKKWNLEQRSANMEEITKSLSKSISSIADFLHQCNDNAPNEHITDDSKPPM